MKNLKDLTPKQLSNLMHSLSDMLTIFKATEGAYYLVHKEDLREVEEFEKFRSQYIEFAENLIEVFKHKQENHFKTTNQENPTTKNN